MLLYLLYFSLELSNAEENKVKRSEKKRKRNSRVFLDFNRVIIAWLLKKKESEEKKDRMHFRSLLSNLNCKFAIAQLWTEKLPFSRRSVIVRHLHRALASRLITEIHRRACYPSACHYYRDCESSDVRGDVSSQQVGNKSTILIANNSTAKQSSW